MNKKLSTSRQPLAVSNWKMTMSVAHSLAFVGDFLALAGDDLEQVEIVLCPPFTALYPVAQAIAGFSLQLGAQDMAATDEIARTGQVSASLLLDAGCQWVMLGHWEARRHLGDDDEIVNRKIRLAFESGLRPIALVGPENEPDSSLQASLAQQLERLLDGCRGEQIARMAFVYEPEAKIGGEAPEDPKAVAEGCGIIRGWLAEKWGNRVAEQVRIIYGGSVAPEYAHNLLASSHVDGLGASRQGRDPESFARIVHSIRSAKENR
jgi:triosephosphate isomerase